MNQLLLAAILLTSFSAQATTVGSWWENRKGVSKFKDKSYYPAYQSFLKALEEDPLNPELQLNLALVFEANEEWEKAEKTYKSALHLIPENSARRFETLFNLAGVLAKQQKYDEALAAYQACLEMDPESKEVKTNIELLFQNGGGQGGKSDQQDKKDQQGKNKQQQDGQDQKKDDKKDQNQDQQDQKKQQPKPFESKELTPQDVKKILDEIKNQEQAIRAQEYERNAKEAPRGKDW